VKSPIKTPFDDIACPVPRAGAADGFCFQERDSIFSDIQPKNDPEEMTKVQFLETADGKPGKKDFIHIPGSVRAGGNYER
jgi:hypothetical protein